MKEIIIAPSMLSANFAELGKGLSEIVDSGADWVHLDIMDGQFVPNLTFGPAVVKDLRQLSNKFFDVHLMVNTPERIAPEFAEAGANAITFHYEASVHSHRLIQEIKGMGIKAGISIVPSTPALILQELLPFVDLVLVMTVNPGFGGQKLLPECLGKVRFLAEEREKRSLDFLISVDGGVNSQNSQGIIAAGADVLVSGSSFFTASDKASFVKGLRG